MRARGYFFLKNHFFQRVLSNRNEKLVGVVEWVIDVQNRVMVVFCLSSTFEGVLNEQGKGY